jgi:hypothetical protein
MAGEKMTVKAEPLTKDKCLKFAEQIENGFSDYNIHVNPSSDIAVFITDMRWLANHINTHPSQLSQSEKERWSYAFLRTQQAVNIAFTLQRLHGSKIPKDKFSIIQQKLDVLNKHDFSRASGHFFELEIAGRLASYFPAEDISFEEPDIVIESSIGKLGIACKCLESEKRLDRGIEQAASQGFSAGIPYFIVIDVSQILRLHIGATARYVDTRENLVLESENFVSNILKNQVRAIDEALKKKASGVIITTRIIGLVSQPELSWHWYTAVSQCPNLEVPDNGYGLQFLSDLLRS